MVAYADFSTPKNRAYRLKLNFNLKSMKQKFGNVKNMLHSFIHLAILVMNDVKILGLNKISLSATECMLWI